MTPRYYAIIGRPRDYPRVRHTVGLPTELDDAAEPPVQLPWPAATVLEPGSDGGFNLLRLATDGSFAGDTWHLSEDEAREQASYEFGDSLGPWQTIPNSVLDPTSYVAQLLASRNISGS